MACIPLLGAIKKSTGEYVYPAIVNKSDDYICPDCKRELCLRKGPIRVHHFAHYKSDNPCTYYSRPSEAQVHKDAKMLLKTLLDNKTPLKIITNCDPSACPDSRAEYEIPETSEASKIIIEHGFDYNGRKIADVAYLDNGEIVCIFEICNTHQTKPENRPEPWFELDATKFINAVNNGKEVQCIRKRTCEKCELVACSSGSDNCLTPGGKSPKWILDANNGYCVACHLNTPVYLNVPFEDRGLIKSYGGVFDSIYRKWYIPLKNKSNHILTLWSVWVPTPEEKRLYAEARKLKEIEDKKARILKEVEEKEARMLKEIEEKEARRLEVIRFNEEQRLWEIKVKEEQLLKKRNRELADLRRKKSAEVLTKLRAEHKPCSKCKSYDRCKKCSDRIWATHNKIIEEFMSE